MKEIITNAITEYVAKHMNRPDINTKWREPIVGFADAEEPYILELRNIISSDHGEPKETMADAKTVIAYFIPFTKELAETNNEPGLASKEWAVAYEETNAMIGEINQLIISTLEAHGYIGAISEKVSTWNKERVMSNWSQRHFAYAAGIGTFGLNNMLITRKGCCGRYGTVVTNAPIQADGPMKEELCLYKKSMAEGGGPKCGVCMKKCPAGALTASDGTPAALTSQGFDRQKCLAVCKANAQVHKGLGNSYLSEDGKADDSGSEVCGKCVTGAPCAIWER